MAEIRVRALEVSLSAGPLARAVAGCPGLDTETLVCLTGNWAAGRSLIAWGPSRQVCDGEIPVPVRTRGPAGAVGGGWFGWQGYDQTTSWWGWFDTVLREDDAGCWWLETVSADLDLSELAIAVQAAASRPQTTGAALHFAQLTRTDEQVHLAAVEHAISAIRAGELFQVNICARFGGRLDGSPLELFTSGVSRLRPDYAAYLQTPARTVVSFSPELFLQRDGDFVRTAPIKGTRRRRVAGDRLDDDPDAVELRHSSKDRAENIMITDLMRNDLARVCRPGSVHTPELLAVRPAPGVWHLVSEVTGRLRPEVARTAPDRALFEAAFPPGSVTGAPKIRALALIDELETAPRGVFTGALGYLAANDSSTLNVAIRTFEFAAPVGRRPDDPTGHRFELGVGGGITADSVPVVEWRECLIKAAPLLALGGVQLDLDVPGAPDRVDLGAGIFDTMLAVDGTIIGLADHLSRLEASVGEVYGSRLPADLGHRLTAAAVSVGPERVRVVVRPGDDPIEITVSPSTPAPDGLALHTRTGRTGSWRHKWNDRRYLSELEPSRAGKVELPLFVNGKGRSAIIAESSRSNIAVIEGSGRLATPALSEDILPGVTRRRLLDAALDRGWPVRLGTVTVRDLLTGRLVLSLNSSGIVGVASLDGRSLDLDHQLLAEIRSWFGEFTV
ncbi:MAG: putative para-aminobenzoate synthase component [Frankiales bacterium]|nr:putative para-aminobenzoate synthase component [Frankiales bacterium]